MCKYVRPHIECKEPEKGHGHTHTHPHHSRIRRHRHQGVTVQDEKIRRAQLRDCLLRLHRHYTRQTLTDMCNTTDSNTQSHAKLSAL